MFTGLIEQVGRIDRIEPLVRSVRLVISVGAMAAQLTPGESIAVDGACLTVESASGTAFQAFASEETLARTTLGAASAGREVNLERALRLGDRLGGHIVQGHVDGTGTFVGLEPAGSEGFILRIAAPQDILDMSIVKGSVTVAGISLTIVELTDTAFSAALIPQSVQSTTLRSLKPGDRVNLETDVLGKYVAKMLRGQGLLKEKSGSKKPSALPGSVFDLLGL
ncbi:TPA: riboflavin synthase [Candidatus Sumerlaeota bacterium]|nr:riboflavin synthase [Candidatus Sumerlaeota bacterium]